MRLQWASKAIKTALVQCEVIDGFMVLRTESAPCTKRLYAELTRCLKVRGSLSFCFLSFPLLPHLSTDYRISAYARMAVP